MSERPLRAMFINCTLKVSPEQSHTQQLVNHAASVMKTARVHVEHIHALSHFIAPGMRPDMTRAGFPDDEWPTLLERICEADILVLATPIWLGQMSSVCSRVIERLYSASTCENRKGQAIFYGKVGGCLVTGNEDGAKGVSMNVIYSLQHIGFSIPPAADAGWIGEAGPGPSYGDCANGHDVPAGYDNEFTNRNTTIMCHNLVHLARLYREHDGFPAHANVLGTWGPEQRFGYPLDASGRPIPTTN